MQRYVGFIRMGVLALLAFLPFQTFFTVWLAGGSSDRIVILSAWKEVLVLALVAQTVAAYKSKVFAEIWRQKLLLVMAAYLLLILIYMATAPDKFAAVVGAAVNGRFIVIFGVAYFAGRGDPGLPRLAMRLMLGAAVLVAVFGIVQSNVLPRDVLTHFGYDRPPLNTTGVPPAYHMLGDSELVRAQSSLRGPNVLGAFLILPLSVAVLAAYRSKRARVSALGMVVLFGLALLLSYSRSAWLGAAAAVIFLAATAIRQKKLLAGGAVASGAVLLTLFVFRNSAFVNQTILHRDTAAAQSSNEGHLEATTRAARDVADHPLGDGLGNAGPASALTNETTIAENYFLQVGQELGWLGLGLLVLIHGLVFRRLWRLRQHWFALALAGSFVGLIITNLLLHTWADEVVSMTWWGLAGLLIGAHSGILKKIKGASKKP